MEQKFSVIVARFRLGRPGVFLVQGFFPDNSAQGIRLRAYLDGRELAVRIEEREGEEVRWKYQSRGPAFAGIDREWNLWIEMPEELSGARSFRVVQEQDGAAKRVFSMGGAQLRRLRELPQCFLETWRQEGQKITVGGWVVSAKESFVRVRDMQGRELDAEVRRLARDDVNAAFPELQEEREGQEPLLPGFEITFQKPAQDTVSLLVEADGLRESYRLSARENGGKYFRHPAIKGPSPLAKGVAYFRRNGLAPTVKRAVEKALGRTAGGAVNYDRWRKSRIPDEKELQKQRQTVFDRRPLISIAVPLYKTPERYLRALVESVQAQTYGNWELVLSDGSGPDSPILRILEPYRSDARIRLLQNGEPLGFSENTNAALAAARGDFVAFADHDDLLAENALFECVREINEHPHADLIYTDEDKVSMDGKSYFQPHFKPDYNPDLLCSMNYFCHLVVVERGLLDRAGMLNKEYDGAQDYDFVLRCAELAKEIRHIPKALYHWRAHKNSTAEDPASKRYAFAAGKRAVQAHYDRLGIRARVEEGEYPGLYRTFYEMPEEKPLVSVIIPNKDHREDLKKCLDSILGKSDYPNLEILIVENNSAQEETFSYYKELESAHTNVRVLYWKGKFNFSGINNFAAAQAAGEYLLFLNNDTEMLRPDCIRELLGPCLRPEVGAVGARLYYPDGVIQHAGVIIGFGGIAGHAFIGSRGDDNGYFSRIICAADYSAVTAACMLVKRSVFEGAGGFSEELEVAFNDIDLCLRIRSLGKLVVYNPYAELYHYESKSRGYEDTPEKVARFNSEIRLFQEKWPEILRQGDPYYNPNLSLNKADYSLNEQQETRRK